MTLLGYTKKLIWCDSTKQQVTIRELEDTILEKYIGGVGIGTKILCDEGLKSKDPFSPDALLVMMTGPFAGTAVPTSGRMSIVAFSPATLSYGESDIGGSWGARLKRCGYDGIVVTGRSERPVYISISSEGVNFGNSDYLWGLDTFETACELKKKFGKRSNVLCIGPAGERLSRMAGIFSDGIHARAAGRGGLGAVLGAKNVKALVVSDQKVPFPVFNEQRLRQSVKESVADIKTRTKALADCGTGGGLLFAEDVGDLPIKNWVLGDWKEGTVKIAGDVVNDRMLKKKYFCNACIVGCGRYIKASTAYGSVEGGGPEYETLGALGSNCMIDDLDAIAYGNELCNRLGIDTLSCGAAVAFAMEAYEKKIITEKDVGYPIRWGDAQAMLRMVKDIGYCEGFGALMTQGVKIASLKIGQGSEKFAVHVKGLEPAMHDPRACASMGLVYATNPNGATHWPACNVVELKKVMIPALGIDESMITDRFSEVGKANLVKVMQDYLVMFNSMKMCRFLVRIEPDRILEWFRMTTGIKHDLESFLLAGERINTLKKLYNTWLGLKKEDDSLPPRILNEKRNTGGAPNYLPNIERMLPEYYDLRGWDKDGIPRAHKIDELGLSDEFMRLVTGISIE